MKAPPPPLVRIIGVGSPFGADRAGWEAVEGLRRGGFGRRYPQVELECADRPGVRLIERLADVDLAVIVDALLGGRPGRILELAPADLQVMGGRSSHGYGVAEALALSAALGGGPRRLVLFGVEVGEGQHCVAPQGAQLAQRLEPLLARYGVRVPKMGESG